MTDPEPILDAPPTTTPRPAVQGKRWTKFPRVAQHSLEQRARARAELARAFPPWTGEPAIFADARKLKAAVIRKYRAALATETNPARRARLMRVLAGVAGMRSR